MIHLSDQWQFYKDKLGQWQWRKFIAKKVVAVSSDGFRSRRACVDNAKTRGYITLPLHSQSSPATNLTSGKSIAEREVEGFTERSRIIS